MVVVKIVVSMSAPPGFAPGSKTTTEVVGEGMVRTMMMEDDMCRHKEEPHDGNMSQLDDHFPHTSREMGNG